MYKKIIFSSLLLLITAVSYSQKKIFEVSSQIENLEGNELWLTVWNGTSASYNLKIPVVNGQFQYKDSLSSPLVIRATPRNESLLKRPSARGTYPTKSGSIWFIALPGSKIKVSGKLTDFAEAYPVGDQENERLVALTKDYFPLLNKEVNLRVKLAKDSSLTVEARSKINLEVAALNKEALEVLKSHVKMNTSSIMALYFMNDLMLRKQMTAEEAAPLLKTVDSKYKKTGFYELVSNRISGGNFVEGAKMLDISGVMPDGNMLSNASLKGKYYLIDFWGSWCGPCMADMPSLKAMQKKFGDKLAILGINQGDNEEKWKSTINTVGLNWYNIMNGKNDKDFVSKLNVTGFPTKILVNPNGVIVYRSTGSGEESMKKLESYIK